MEDHGPEKPEKKERCQGDCQVIQIRNDGLLLGESLEKGHLSEKLVRWVQLFIFSLSLLLVQESPANFACLCLGREEIDDGADLCG